MPRNELVMRPKARRQHADLVAAIAQVDRRAEIADRDALGGGSQVAQRAGDVARDENPTRPAMRIASTVPQHDREAGSLARRPPMRQRAPRAGPLPPRSCVWTTPRMLSMASLPLPVTTMAWAAAKSCVRRASMGLAISANLLRDQPRESLGARCLARVVADQIGEMFAMPFGAGDTRGIRREIGRIARDHVSRAARFRRPGAKTSPASAWR